MTTGDGHKTKPLTNQDGTLAGYIIFCPGCECGHLFHTEPWSKQWYDEKMVKHTASGPVWEFNGDVLKPTFTPSMLVNKSLPKKRCHSFVKAGQIQFLSDCFHKLKNTTVALPDISVW